ncbi:hypothetical protein DF185_22225 [Marinifilum breve]|uniref:Uncharacterized protein n=1 Tax=Marinifilum breve TaxID=2184082 RepID=A0A2V3ZRD9_9BACT|nr:hypothetical protein [Marinifilum breve]PXX95436.1 hypothetical protein DF185_22225 [Marinifilum breve]
MEFRQENFITFIKNTKLPFVFNWPLNIGFLIILMILIFQISATNLAQDLVAILFVTIGFVGMKVFVYGMNYKMFSAGGKAIKQLKENENILLQDVAVYIRNFDFYSQNNKMDIRINKVIYDFNSSDIVLTENTIILMGKGFGIGFVGYAYPVELVVNQSLTSLPQAKIINYFERGSRVEVHIKDRTYKKIIKIEFKEKVEVLSQWLSNFKDIIGDNAS